MSQRFCRMVIFINSHPVTNQVGQFRGRRARQCTRYIATRQARQPGRHALDGPLDIAPGTVLLHRIVIRPLRHHLIGYGFMLCQ